jgi:hypothetical protein
MKIDSPIIIIGNARSGSSLLNHIFSAHPEILMFGELRFAVAQTWRAMSEIFRTASAYRLLDYFNENPGMREELVQSPSLMQKTADRLEPDSEKRRGEIVRRAISEALSLYERRQTYWGYKEITNAGEAEWSIYDAVFPEAWYIHVIRNPLECVRSAIWHRRQQLTDDVIVQHLNSWTTVFGMSRQRSESNQYYEVQYERLIANPEEVLAPFLNAIDIGWHERCGEALRQQVGARSERFEMPAHLCPLIAAIPKLTSIMDELGYPLTPLSGRPSREEISAVRVVPTEDGRWRLCGRIWPEEGLAWQFDLDQTHLGSELAAFSDDVDVWSRSPLRLFEDGRPLGPGHALHRLIRGKGNGSYSHWQARLIFSTSDNSDPNMNGRTYSFDLSQESGIAVEEILVR